MTGLEKAVWWIEYVIRHKGAPYFRVAAVDATWREFLFADVVAFLLLLLIVTLYVSYKTLYLLIRLTKALVIAKTKVA